MNRSLINLAAIAGVAALGYFLGVVTASKTMAAKDNVSIGHVACLFGVVCGFVLLYIGLTDAQIRRETTEEKSARADEQVRIATEINRLALAVGGLAPSKAQAVTTGGGSGEPGGLTEAVGVLAKDLASREKEMTRLLDVFRRKESRNALARIATIRDTAEFTRRINDAGKLDDKEALRQLILEIEAAVEDLGMEVLHIAAGTKVSDLPNGSFAILNASDPEVPALAGTVKESLSDAIFLRDESGRQVFISPAKLRVYRL